MDADLYRLLLALTGCAAEQLAQGGEPDGGLELLREYREVHGDPDSQATDTILRYGLLHLGGPQLRALEPWEGPRASDGMARRFALTLRILKDELFPDEELTPLRHTVDEDWVWHYPLGIHAWNSREHERAWDHFHRYYIRSGSDQHQGGLFRRMSWAFLIWYRKCQACGSSPASVHHRPVPRYQVLGLCQDCKALAEDSGVMNLVRQSNVDKGDRRLKALSTFTRIFDFLGESRPRRRSNRLRTWETRLRYHRVATLEKLLDEECQLVFAQARETAKEHGLQEPDSCCLLIHALRFRGSDEASGSGLEELAFRGIGQDEPGALRDVLNITRWLAVLGYTECTRLGVGQLLQGLGFAEKGAASSLMAEASPGHLYLPSCTERQKAEVKKLRQRFGLRFLTALEQSHKGHQGLLWLIRNEPQISFVPDLEKESKKRVEVILAWRDALRENPGREVFSNSWGVLGHLYPAAGREFYRYGYRLLGYTCFLSTLYVTPAVRKRREARRLFRVCYQRYTSSKSEQDRLIALSSCRRLAETAGLNAEWEHLTLLYLAEPETDVNGEWERDRARRELVLASLEQGHFETAFERLMDYAQECLPNSETSITRLGQKLWRAGYREEFHQVLERVGARKDADRNFLEQTQAAYRVMERIWTPEEVKSFEPKYLSSL